MVPGNKMLALNILDILHKYTDAEHRISQKEISEILKTEYHMTVERKALQRCLVELADYLADAHECGILRTFDYEIKSDSPIMRMTSKKDLETGQIVKTPTHIMSDIYLVRDFTEGELRLLIDSILFSGHVPYSQCRELIEKLERLSNIYFKSHMKHVVRLPDEKADNNQLFLNVELIDEAINGNRKILFKYLEYGTDKRLHVKKRSDGSEREYTISPYQMAARGGKYYLICNNDRYDTVSNYRVDRIKDIRILDEPVKPFEKLKLTNGRILDLDTYMKEHVYMFSGETVRVTFRIVREMISDILDMFGSDVKFSDETETHVTVSARVNEQAMVQFAKSFAPDVVILAPGELRKKIKNDLQKSLNYYE